jgi:hypothetical protein
VFYKSVGQSRNSQRWICAHWTRHNRTIRDDETRKAEDLPECVNYPMISVTAHRAAPKGMNGNRAANIAKDVLNESSTVEMRNFGHRSIHVFKVFERGLARPIDGERAFIKGNSSTGNIATHREKS